MSDLRLFLDNLWKWKCNLPEKDIKVELLPDFETLANQQISHRFIKLMTNRMVMGTFRYGKWQDNQKNNIEIDRISSIRKRLDLFDKTGNTELLVDCANLCMIEFEITSHPNKHFHSTDDGTHCNIIN